MERRWTINGRFLAQPVTGVQRYAREVVSELDSLITDQHPLADNLVVELLVPPDVKDQPRLRSIRVRSVGSFGGHAWEQTVLPLAQRGGLISLCNTGPAVARRHIVCIHDLNTRLFPRSYSLPFRLLYRMLLPVLGRVAENIVTVSSFSAAQLVGYRVCTSAKLAIAPDGYEHALRWKPRHSAATKDAVGELTIVVLGSLAPHKNIGLIIRMSERLAAAGFRIALVGGVDDRVFKAVDEGARSGIIWLGRLADEELAALLQDSMCLAFPSFAEGFGLPVVEAMAIGCPVVASDRASLPEIGSDAVLYASPEDGDAWFRCFERLRHNPGLRGELVRRGRKRAEQFPWRASAARYLELMARADGYPTDAGLLSERQSAPVA